MPGFLLHAAFEHQSSQNQAHGQNRDREIARIWLVYQERQFNRRHYDESADAISRLLCSIQQTDHQNEIQSKHSNDSDQTEILGKYIRKTLHDDWNRPLAGQPRVRINTIGFFYESPDVGAFLWALARENDGSFVGMSKP